MTTKTTRPSWDDRCLELASWFEEHGRNPSQLSEERAELLGLAVPSHDPAAATKRPFEQRLDELEAFYAEHRRLPRKSNTADAHERRLAGFLIQQLRTAVRTGVLSAEYLNRAEKIPGAIEIRTVQNQDDILNELAGYTARNGTLPPLGGSGTPEENRLANWMRNNTRGSLEEKTPRLQERHKAILNLMTKFPAKSDALEAARLQELEEFITAHGRRPSIHKEADPEERRLAIWLANHQDNQDPRVVAALQTPSRVELQWEQNFQALANYAASHDGRPPGSWHEGRIFSWLTIQRREYRKGKMSPERLAKLLTIDGVIPGKTVIADAA